jgi:hypothetical protein
VGSRGLRLLTLDDFNLWAVRDSLPAYVLVFTLDLPFAMDLSIVFVLATVVDLLALRLIPTRKRALRFVCISALFIVQTILIVGLIGSPFRPVFRVKDLPREFWLQLLACAWWALAAREMIGILALPEVLKKGPKENKILSDIIAACVYVCSGRGSALQSGRCHERLSHSGRAPTPGRCRC